MQGQAVLKNDRELVEHFSTRRKELLSVVVNPLDRAERERANLRTRPNKKYVPLEELFKKWFEKLKALGKTNFAPKKSYRPPLSEEEERKNYLIWLADKVREIQEEFKQEKDLKQESKPYRRRR